MGLGGAKRGYSQSLATGRMRHWLYGRGWMSKAPHDLNSATRHRLMRRHLPAHCPLSAALSVWWPSRHRRDRRWSWAFCGGVGAECAGQVLAGAGDGAESTQPDRLQVLVGVAQSTQPLLSIITQQDGTVTDADSARIPPSLSRFSCSSSPHLLTTTPQHHSYSLIASCTFCLRRAFQFHF